MRGPFRLFLLVVLSVTILGIPGCKKKTPPLSPQPTTSRQPDQPSVASPDVSAPTVSLSASPTTIERGEQTTLSWDSSNTSSLAIDGGVGNVGESGSIVVSPRESTTFTAIARGAGGEARASTRVTVVDPTPSVDVSTDADRLQEAINRGQVQPIFFAYDKADLSEESKRILNENAKIFRMYPQAKVVVEGHCDERGTEEYNLALGDRRAVAARDYLLQVGVDASQMQTISFGEERPFAMGQDEASYAKNRRAHFSVQR